MAIYIEIDISKPAPKRSKMYIYRIKLMHKIPFNDSFEYADMRA